MKQTGKSIIRIITILLINVGLVPFSFWLYYWPTKAIKAYTESINEVEFWISLPFLIGVIFFFTVNKKFRNFGIGLTAFCYSFTLFLLFFTNKQFANEGKFKTVYLYHSIESKETNYLVVTINNWTCKVEVSPENCLVVDSVKVRIDNGLFGMRTITQDVIIEESNNCEHASLDSTYIVRSHSLAGGQLAEKRCFAGAIFQYTQCIKLDSVTPYFYTQRGRMFLAIKDYKNALSDFWVASWLEFNSHNKVEISKLNDTKLMAIKNDLKKNIEMKQYDSIGKNLEILTSVMNINTNAKLIKVCLDKLQ